MITSPVVSGLDAQTARALTQLVTQLQNALSGFTSPTVLVGQFSASAGAWTGVPSLARCAYARVGPLIILDFLAAGTSVSTTPVELRLQLPAGFVSVSDKGGPCAIVDNGTPKTGLVRAHAGLPYLSFYTDLNGTAWAASTGGTAIQGQLVLEVQP